MRRLLLDDGLLSGESVEGEGVSFVADCAGESGLVGIEAVIMGVEVVDPTVITTIIITTMTTILLIEHFHPIPFPVNQPQTGIPLYRHLSQYRPYPTLLTIHP